MESGLSSKLRSEPEDRLSRPSAGSLKVGTDWEFMPCVRTGFLGCGKWSFLLARMEEYKEEDQTQASALSTPTFARTLRSRAPQLQRARVSSSLRPPNPASAGEWVSRGVEAPAGTGKPRSPGTAHRCLRSACWSLRDRSSMRTFLSWSRCSRRFTFICRT